jgi:rhodanese-related sulfurtransferase
LTKDRAARYQVFVLFGDYRDNAAVASDRFLGGAAMTLFEGGPQVPAVTPAELEAERRRKGGVRLVDVREADEYAEVRAPYGDNYPLSLVKQGSLPLLGKAERVYLVCRSGRRSETAAKILLAAGFTDVINVEGGMMAWEQAGLPVSKG